MNTSGKFDVKLTPLDTNAKGENGINLARMAIDKTYKGELDAKGSGEMLSAMTSVQGSAGYVAIEQVVGTLSGKKGSFVLQHSGIMDNGEKALTLVVVPDSGTGELSGLAGKMAIRVEEGNHYYKFEYQIGK